MRKLMVVLSIACLILLVAIPLIATGGYQLNILVMVFIYIVLAVSLDLTLGYAGQFSFAHAAFFGIGAYTAAIMQRDLGTDIWINLPAAMVISGVFGILLGLPALRLRGHFLAIVTIAFQTIVYLALSQWTSFTGGQFGLSLRPVAGFESVQRFYYLALAVCAVTVALAWLLVRSRLGQSWRAVRDDEVLARAIGLNTTALKLGAFVIASAFAGAAGAIQAHYIRGVTPDDFTILISALVVAMVVVGGRGTLWGPLLGAAVFTALPEVLSSAASYKLIIFSVLMIVMVIALPQGLFGLALQRRVK
jgi:branched-chain amino acid transport system permease protein